MFSVESDYSAQLCSLSYRVRRGQGRKVTWLTFSKAPLLGKMDEFRESMTMACCKRRALGVSLPTGLQSDGQPSLSRLEAGLRQACHTPGITSFLGKPREDRTVNIPVCHRGTERLDKSSRL